MIQYTRGWNNIGKATTKLMRRLNLLDKKPREWTSLDFIRLGAALP